jgi:hypothetical protein
LLILQHKTKIGKKGSREGKIPDPVDHALPGKVAPGSETSPKQ